MVNKETRKQAAHSSDDGKFSTRPPAELLNKQNREPPYSEQLSLWDSQIRIEVNVDYGLEYF